MIQGIPDGGLVAEFLRKSTLFVHVSSADELHAEVVAENLGGSDLHLEDTCGLFKVALVTVHNNTLVTTVEPVSQLLTPGNNRVLHVALLSVHVQQTVALIGQGGHLDDAGLEGVEHLHVVFRDTDTAADSDSLKEVIANRRFEKLVEVGVGVDLETSDLVLMLVMLELEGVEEALQLLLSEGDTALDERVANVANLDGVLLVVLEDVIHENLLGSAEASEDVHRDESGELDGQVAFAAALGHCNDRLLHDLEEVRDFFFVHLFKAFYRIVGDAIDVLLLDG
mmetsp:Transcript_28725/g.43387  ORF Transcript_28725/g.43387 Transcript_28725/m.43387 type:complete len:282 (-) Transcript_28725:424-1269(-)